MPAAPQDRDVIVGGWLGSLGAAGKPARPQGRPPEHVAIDGKWPRGVGDGPVKLFSALQHGDGVIIARTRIPNDTNETTQVKTRRGTPEALAAMARRHWAIEDRRRS